MTAQGSWRTQWKTCIICSVIYWFYWNYIDDLEIMEGEDVNDSNCIDFSKITKIREKGRVLDKGHHLNESKSLKDMTIGSMKIINYF